jgi:hypothetical protein
MSQVKLFAARNEGAKFLHFLPRRLMATMADIKVGEMCTLKPQTWRCFLVAV